MIISSEKLIMEKKKFDEKPIIIAMKGHPGTGKTTLAKSIAKKLKYPLIDKDHCKDCTKQLQETLNSLTSPKTSFRLLNDLSYEVMWNSASTQLSLGISVVIVSPLSRRAHFDRLLDIASRTNSRVVVVECRPENEAEWRRRVERRGVVEGSSWHKPKSWEEIEKLIDGYKMCWDYDLVDVPKFVVDTTSNIGIDEMASSVVEFLASVL